MEENEGTISRGRRKETLKTSERNCIGESMRNRRKKEDAVAEEKFRKATAGTHHDNCY